jgi:uncharacterized protein (TIGR02996 family)
MRPVDRATARAAQAAERAALAAVIADPDADGPRLAYADVIEAEDPDRARYIRVSLQRLAPALDASWAGRAVGEHAHRWAAPVIRYVHAPPAGGGFWFERGFVAYIRTTPAEFLGPLPTLAPIQHVDFLISDDTGRAAFRRVLDSPYLSSIRSMRIDHAGLTDDDAVVLAASPGLRGCWWIQLASNRIGRRGMEALAASEITRKSCLSVDDNPGDPGLQHQGDWIIDSWLPEFGQELEARYGPLPWLHHPYNTVRPSRYEPREFRSAYAEWL